MEQVLQTTAVRCASTAWRLQSVSVEEGTLLLRASLDTEITFCNIEAVAALTLLCVSADTSLFGNSVLGSPSSATPIWSLPKKCSTAETCLHSRTLGQSGQSQDLLP